LSSLVKHKSADIDNRYLRGKVIGMGKKSKIYHGQNRKTGKLRAIKSLNPQNQMNSGVSKQVDSKNEALLLS
jgi:SUMO ligase MMS21 Smc5/6 complex component